MITKTSWIIIIIIIIIHSAVNSLYSLVSMPYERTYWNYPSFRTELRASLVWWLIGASTKLTWQFYTLRVHPELTAQTQYTMVRNQHPYITWLLHFTFPSKFLALLCIAHSLFSRQCGASSRFIAAIIAVMWFSGVDFEIIEISDSFCSTMS